MINQIKVKQQIKNIDKFRHTRIYNIHIYIYHRILFSHRREKNSAPCNDIDKPEGVMLSERSQTEADKYYVISLTGGI